MTKLQFTKPLTSSKAFDQLNLDPFHPLKVSDLGQKTTSFIERKHMN